MTITPNILYRISDTPDVHVTTSSKGIPLTSREIDGNFKSIQNSITTVSTGVSTTSIDANTDLSTLVDHAGMRYYVQKVEDAKPKQHVYTVISTGYVSSRTGVGIYKNGLKVRGGSRSYNLIKIDKSSGDIVYQNTFDVNNGAQGQYSVAIDLANELNATTESQYVILYTHDEPSYNRLTTELQDAIYRCGGSKAIYGSSEFAYRSAYILIGGYNLGEGNGVELYKGRNYTAPDGVQGDPDAYLEVSFQIIDGKLCGIGNDSSTAFGYVSKDDFNDSVTDLRDNVDQLITDLTEYVIESIENNQISDKFIGAVTYFAMTSVDVGWLPCDGSAYSRTEHAKLFAKIGTLYGSGDGSTTFNVPNLFDEFIRGVGANRAIGSWQSAYGAGLAEYQAARNPSGENNDNNARIVPSDGSWSQWNVTGRSMDWDDHHIRFKNYNVHDLRPHNVALLPCIYSGVGTAAQFESFTLTAGVDSVNEGSSISFNITGIGNTNRTNLYWEIESIVGDRTIDFIGWHDTVTLSNNTAAFIVTTVSNTAMTDRSFRVKLYDDSNKGKLLSQTGTITIANTTLPPVSVTSFGLSFSTVTGLFSAQVTGIFSSGTVFYVTERTGGGKYMFTATQSNYVNSLLSETSLLTGNIYNTGNMFDLRIDSYTGQIMKSAAFTIVSPDTCFPKDSIVLLADGSLKAIQDITTADVLMGANGSPVSVQKLDTPLLGNRKMYQFSDGHTWSEEHAHWVFDNETQREWWWSANTDVWRAEVASGAIGGLKDNGSIISHNNVKFAHISGFVTREMTQVDYPPETQLYLPITDGTPIIVDGYVVGAGVNEFGFDYTRFQWIPSRIKELE